MSCNNIKMSLFSTCSYCLEQFDHAFLFLYFFTVLNSLRIHFWRFRLLASMSIYYQFNVRLNDWRLESHFEKDESFQRCFRVGIGQSYKVLLFKDCKFFRHTSMRETGLQLIGSNLTSCINAIQLFKQSSALRITSLMCRYLTFTH